VISGIETEYGIVCEGVGPEGLVERARDFVKSWTTDCFMGWDYSLESPRSDLRGFKVDHLQVDPLDAQFERSSSIRQTDADVRADRVLANGARIYNDHGHPEYSTPECRSLRELALHDQAGELFVSRLAARDGVQLYKNNTDFHGASYGTHESYLVPRAIGFEKLSQALIPLLVVRQLLVGAGKVGAESGDPCDFQVSQRADFFMESANVETLYRRPIFNTRDEPHADPRSWVRLHVIAGDANMMPSCTVRKVGLVRLVLKLLEQDLAPAWKLRDPVGSIRGISRSRSVDLSLELEGNSWTTPAEILESYFAAADQLSPNDELVDVVEESRQLIGLLSDDPWSAATQIDWVAKHMLLESFREDAGLKWSDPALQALDLQYHAVDRDEGLYYAFAEANDLLPDARELEQRLTQVFEGTRARARSIAVRKFRDELSKASWSSLSFKNHPELYLNPISEFPVSLEDCLDVESFISHVKSL